MFMILVWLATLAFFAAVIFLMGCIGMRQNLELNTEKKQQLDYVQHCMTIYIAAYVIIGALAWGYVHFGL